MARRDKNKEVLIEQLKKTPIIQVACEKCGVPRSTYYRWHKEDQEFSETVDAAILDGSRIINDLAESQLVSAIKDQNLTAIIFWLKHHHPSYATKIEVTNKSGDKELTPEQEESIKNALLLASLIKEEKHEQEAEQTTNN